MQYDDPTTDRRDVDSSGDPVTSPEPHLPKLVLEMLDVRLADPLQTYSFDTFGQAQEGGLHVFGQRGDLGIDDGSQGLDDPCRRATDIGSAEDELTKRIIACLL